MDVKRASMTKIEIFVSNVKKLCSVKKIKSSRAFEDQMIAKLGSSLSHSSLSGYFNSDKKVNPRLDSLVALSTFFDTDVSHLLSPLGFDDEGFSRAVDSDLDPHAMSKAVDFACKSADALNIKNPEVLSKAICQNYINFIKGEEQNNGLDFAKILQELTTR